MGVRDGPCKAHHQRGRSPPHRDPQALALDAERAVVPPHRKQGLLAAGEADRQAGLAPLRRLEPLSGVAPDHRARSDPVELPEAHPGDLPAQRLVRDDRRELPLPELAVAVEHQGADVPGRAQQAVQATALGPGGTDGDPGAAVQGGFHGHPWYGRPPTESNICLPLCKDFFRKILASGSAGNSANVFGHGTAWHQAWKATAQRVAEIGEQALASGHRVNAREALLRAANYYRTAGDFLLEHPATDPEMTLLSAGQHDTFAAAAALFDTPVEAVSIPYEDTTLPAYLFLVDDSGAARPTIIYNSGYDSTREESYFVIAAAALRRGYNVVAFDGPGQRPALRDQKLVMRPDWEAVVTPVVDYALTRDEIAADEIVLFGYSLGGYLVARAAAFEHRVAALILDDGIHDFHAAFAGSLPPFLGSWIEDGRDDVAVPVLTMLTAVSTQVRWGLRNGIW